MGEQLLENEQRKLLESDLAAILDQLSGVRAQHPAIEPGHSGCLAHWGAFHSSICVGELGGTDRGQKQFSAPTALKHGSAGLPHGTSLLHFNYSGIPMNTALHIPRQARGLFAGALLAVLTASASAGGHPAPAKPEFGTATLVGEVSVPGFGDGCPIESADGLSLFIASNRPGTAGGNDIWAADRDSLGSAWGTPRNLGAPINTASADFCPTPVLGRSLFFVSERPGDGTGPTPCGGGDIYLSRQSPAGGWSAPQMLKCAPEGPNFPGGVRSPSLVETWFGTFLFYSCNGRSEE